jgi:hypothetical protein
MPRAYTIATAALTLGVPTKWLDNTASHFRIEGVHRQRQGVARRFSLESLIALAISVVLTQELGIPLARALELAPGMMASDGQIAVGDRLVLSIDLAALRTELLRRLEHAVEVAPLPRRGRPPGNTTGRL